MLLVKGKKVTIGDKDWYRLGMCRAAQAFDVELLMRCAHGHRHLACGAQDIIYLR